MSVMPPCLCLAMETCLLCSLSTSPGSLEITKFKALISKAKILEILRSSDDEKDNKK